MPQNGIVVILNPESYGLIYERLDGFVELFREQYFAVLNQKAYRTEAGILILPVHLCPSSFVVGPAQVFDDRSLILYVFDPYLGAVTERSCDCLHPLDRFKGREPFIYWIRQNVYAQIFSAPADKRRYDCGKIRFRG